jgi:hypothetical protein
MITKHLTDLRDIIDNFPYKDIWNGKVSHIVEVYDNETTFVYRYSCLGEGKDRQIFCLGSDNCDSEKEICYHICNHDNYKEKLQPDLDWIREVFIVYKKFPKRKRNANT